MFRGLAAPRRAVIEQLSRGPAPVTTLARPFAMALPSFTQHLAVLEACGLVTSVKVEREPLQLFADDYQFGGGNSIANYDVTADGRFIMIRRGPNGGKLRVVLNWTEELKQILAAGGVK